MVHATEEVITGNPIVHEFLILPPKLVVECILLVLSLSLFLSPQPLNGAEALTEAGNNPNVRQWQ
jgi:hypothetical protein